MTSPVFPSPACRRQPRPAGRIGGPVIFLSVVLAGALFCLTACGGDVKPTSSPWEIPSPWGR